MHPAPAPAPAAVQRLDRWLWFARFCKSRSLAQKLVEAGKVRVNRIVTDKPAAPLKVGDVLTFQHGPDIRVVRVLGLGHRRGPPPKARTLYQEIAPRP